MRLTSLRHGLVPLAVYCSYCYYQELIVKSTWGPSHKLFTGFSVVVLLSRVVSTVALVVSLLWSNGGKGVEVALDRTLDNLAAIETPMLQLFLLACYEVIASNCRWKALEKLSYTTLATFSSARLLPTLLINFLNYGIIPSVDKVVSVGLAAVGLWTYSNSPSDSLSFFEDDSVFYDTVLGSIFLVIYVYFSNLSLKQRRDFTKILPPKSRLPEWVLVNLFASLLSVGVVVYEGVHGRSDGSVELFLNTGMLALAVLALVVASVALQFLQLSSTDGSLRFQSFLPLPSILLNDVVVGSLSSTGFMSWCGIGWLFGGVWIETLGAKDVVRPKLHAKRNSNDRSSNERDTSPSSPDANFNPAKYICPLLVPPLFSILISAIPPSPATTSSFLTSSSPPSSPTFLRSRPPLLLSHGIPIEGGNWEADFHTFVNPNCSNEPAVRWPGTRRTGLVSHPRSGNTFVRELVERSTGFQTSTAGYCDGSLKKTFVAECDKSANFLIKTHFPDRLWKSRGTPVDKRPVKQNYNSAKAQAPHKFDQIVQVVRNPIDALYSNYHFAHAPKLENGQLDHAARVEVQLIGTTKIDRQELITQARTWAAHDNYWSGLPIRAHKMRYESLLLSRLPELLSLLNFLLPPTELPSLTQVACTLELNPSREAYKSRKSVPFASWEKWEPKLRTEVIELVRENWCKWDYDVLLREWRGTDTGVDNVCDGLKLKVTK